MGNDCSSELARVQSKNEQLNEIFDQLHGKDAEVLQHIRENKHLWQILTITYAFIAVFVCSWIVSWCIFPPNNKKIRSKTDDEFKRIPEDIESRIAKPIQKDQGIQASPEMVTKDI